MSVETDERRAQVVQVIAHWHSLAQLAEFAAKRHGFGDDNGGFGVIYADGLDEYATQVEGHIIPDGCVEIYGYWGAAKGGFEFVIEEREYLSILAHTLRERGLIAEALTVESLAN